MIHFFSEDTGFTLSKQNAVKSWISGIIQKEKLKEGEINYIFCSDEYLHEINLQYLNHDTYTDIITFDQSDGADLSADIYISIDRVTENASEQQVSFRDELHRVMIHGILHLAGYGDKTPKEKQLMREKEDVSLSLRQSEE